MFTNYSNVNTIRHWNAIIIIIRKFLMRCQMIFYHQVTSEIFPALSVTVASRQLVAMLSLYKRQYITKLFNVYSAWIIWRLSYVSKGMFSMLLDYFVSQTFHQHFILSYFRDSLKNSCSYYDKLWMIIYMHGTSSLYREKIK